MSTRAQGEAGRLRIVAIRGLLVLLKTTKTAKDKRVAFASYSFVLFALSAYVKYISVRFSSAFRRSGVDRLDLLHSSSICTLI